MTRSRLSDWIPALTVLSAVILESIYLPWSAWSVLRPDLTLVTLFYWRLYRPDLCRIITPFMAGWMVDILSALPPGVNATSKILLVLMVGMFATRLRTTYFLVLVPVLMFFSLAEQSMQWGLLSLERTLEPNWEIMVGKALATGLLAPLAVALLIRIHTAWLEVR